MEKLESSYELSQTERIQRESFDQLTSTYDLHYCSWAAIYYREALFSQLLRNENFNGKTVLDALCGGGPATGYFQGKGASVIGLDISPAQCAKYRQRCPSTEVVCRSIFDSGFPSESFDYVYTDSLHHLHPQIHIALRELSRILKPGGKLIVWEPLSLSLFNGIRSIWYRLDKRYFCANEKALGPSDLTSNEGPFQPQNVYFGGGIGYVLSFMSWALRLSPKLLREGKYLKSLIESDFKFQKIQPRWLSFWMFATLIRR